MKFVLPELKKQLFEMDIPIRWGDMDAMGHVNNCAYLQYFESVRVDWFRAMDAQPNPQGEGPLVLNVFCDFMKQLEHPGTVKVRLYGGEVNRSSFDCWVTFERTDAPGVIHATGGATNVWVDFPKQKSAPLPERLRKLLLA